MKTTYASIALSIAMTGAAVAADLPSRRAPPVFAPPIPVFTWTGFYVGGQIGYEFGNTNDTLIAPGGALVVGPYQVGQTGAVIGGAHVGYLYQLGGLGGAGSVFGGGIVVGLEGDIEGSNNTSSVSPVAGLLDQHKSQVEGSARGRLGIAVDRALFYATGGAAFAQFKDQISAGGAVLGTASTSRVGYTVGGGAEYAITPAFSLRAEYRYSDFGSYAVVRPGPFPTGGTSIHNVNEQKVEVGFSYRFADVLAPVVARY